MSTTITWAAPIAPLYNAALAFYYLGTIRYNWNDRRIAQVERVFHVIVWLLGLSFAIIGLKRKLYNLAGNFVCWIRHSPPGCLDSSRHGKEVANCERGDNAVIFQWAFYVFFGWLSFIIMVSCLTSVYLTVLKIEKQRDSYRFQQTEDVDRNLSRRVFEQGLLYGGAFVLSWAIVTTGQVLFLITGKVYVVVVILVVTLVPLQGFWNYWIYRRESTAAVLSDLAEYFCCGCFCSLGGGAITTSDRDDEESGQHVRKLQGEQVSEPSPRIEQSNTNTPNKAADENTAVVQREVH